MDTAAPTTPLDTARVIAADIKLHHSVFAMPFAVLAAYMAAAPEGRVTDWPRFAGPVPSWNEALVVTWIRCPRNCRYRRCPKASMHQTRPPQ